MRFAASPVTKAVQHEAPRKTAMAAGREAHRHHRLKLPPPVEQRFVDIERRLAALEGVCPMACPANCSKRCPMAVQS